MFLAIAQFWIKAAERLEEDMGLKPAAPSGPETQTPQKITPPSSFNNIPTGEMRSCP